MQNKVEIITIGDEILIGQIVDTNSAFMAQALSKEGFVVTRIFSVGDCEEDIVDAVRSAFDRADVVLLTGGIGPTKDDITKHTLCKIFDTELVFSPAVLENIEQIFAHRTLAMNELTRAQAFVPKSAAVIQNRAGTAPITWFEHTGKVLVSMPGVPYEMEFAMGEILPRLHRHFHTPTVIHHTLLVVGFPESALAMKIADWENALPPFIKLAYLPAPGIVKLRLSGILEDKIILQKNINEQTAKLHELLGEAIVADEDIAFEVLIGNLLKANSLTLATAESCTGGNIAHRLTSVAGSSAYFKGSVVSYANEVKQNVLGVSADSLQDFGAVSQTVVEQMALNARRLLGSDIAVATSGVAGPDGGTTEKPVGTVWIAVCRGERLISRRFQFGGNRLRNIEMATLNAFVMVKEIIEK